MRAGLTPLVALGLGVVGYLLTRQLVAGVLVAAAAFWFLRTRGAPPRRYSPPLPEALPRRERATGMSVVCKRVTPERQEWVSSRTGRIFEVLSQNGPPAAKPGDPGEVIVSAAGYSIVASARHDES